MDKLYPRQKLSQQFEEEAETDLSVPSRSSKSAGSMPPHLQLAVEVGKWQAKYETLKENLNYERKKRNEVEEDLRKLAYELGGVKNEVRQLEEKLKLLSAAASTETKAPESQEEKSAPDFSEPKIESRRPAGNYSDRQPVFQPAAEIISEPANHPEEKIIESLEPTPNAQFAEVQTLKQPQIELAAAEKSPVAEKSVPKIKETKAEIIAEAALAVIQPEEKSAAKPAEDNAILGSLQNNFQSHASEVWDHVRVLMANLNNSPLELYEEIISNKANREGSYYLVEQKIANLNEDYRYYQELVPAIGKELENFAKVIPYVKNICVSHYTDTV